MCIENPLHLDGQSGDWRGGCWWKQMMTYDQFSKLLVPVHLLMCNLPPFKIYPYMHSHLFALIVPIPHCSKNMHSTFHLGWTFQSLPHSIYLKDDPSMSPPAWRYMLEDRQWIPSSIWHKIWFVWPSSCGLWSKAQSGYCGCTPTCLVAHVIYLD